MSTHKTNAIIELRNYEIINIKALPSSHWFQLYQNLITNLQPLSPSLNSGPHMLKVSWHANGWLYLFPPWPRSNFL